MTINFSKKKLLDIANSPKVIEITEWFEATLLPTTLLANSKVYENYFKPTGKAEIHYIGYGNGFSYLFDSKGTYTDVGGGPYDDINDCILEWGNRFVSSLETDLDNIFATRQNIAWKLTPISKPSDKFIEKCKLSYARALIIFFAEEGYEFSLDILK